MNPATDASKTALENIVTWYLSEKINAATVPIVTQKFLTHDNRLIYLTRCTMAEPAVAKIKVQIFERVDGGVHETSYQLYGDNRYEKSQNAMIFGSQPTAPDNTTGVVSDTEATELVALVTDLQNSARAIL